VVGDVYFRVPTAAEQLMRLQNVHLSHFTLRNTNHQWYWHDQGAA